MITYKLFNELDRIQKRLVNDIFFSTSSIKIFENSEAKERFFQKYLGIYQLKHPDHFICASEDEKILGYICGAVNSKSERELYISLLHFKVFEDFYEKYPAHLHINISPEFSGKGLGSKLIKKYEEHLIDLGIIGVHLITNPTSRNVHFYQKNDYSFTCEREFNGHRLLFMAKTLST